MFVQLKLQSDSKTNSKGNSLKKESLFEKVTFQEEPLHQSQMLLLMKPTVKAVIDIASSNCLILFSADTALLIGNLSRSKSSNDNGDEDRSLPPGGSPSGK